MSIGLDTSVVLRLLTGQPAGQASTARRRLEQAVADGEAVFVTDLVLGETYFALQHHYKVTEDRARNAILSMLQANVLSPTPASAVEAFASEEGPGVLDRLIHGRHRSLDLVTLTFDRQMARLEASVRLPAR